MRKLLIMIFLFLSGCTSLEPVEVFPEATEVRFFFRQHDEEKERKWLSKFPHGMRLSKEQVKSLRSALFIETDDDKELTACALETYFEFQFFDSSNNLIGKISVSDDIPGIEPQNFHLNENQYFYVNHSTIYEIVDELKASNDVGC